MTRKIGFIGLGTMGKPMARNLLSAGYSLVVYNRSKDAVRELEESGARGANSAKEVASQTDVVITMLPNAADVSQVILGPAGVIKGTKQGNIIIDMSTIAYKVTRKIAAEFETRGMEMLDAPVSGGEQGAIIEQRKIELETRIEQAKQTEVDMECIGRFCELVRQNLGDFTFDDKRLALEALRIKVWVDGNEINIEGAIPVAGEFWGPGH